MGGIVSKISPDLTLDHGINESFNRLKSSFDRTPKYRVIDDKMIDPRSATLEINRTPLCLLDVPDDDGSSTPVVRNRKKSKRRSSSRFRESVSSKSELSNSFEFSTDLSDRSTEPHLVPWEPRPQKDLNVEEPVKDVVDTPTDHKYETVVEELRKCLGKVSMTPVYVDEDYVNQSSVIETPPNTKDMKKKLFWTPDVNLTSLSPINKERTPLGTVNSNMASNRLNSSALWRGGKMWKGPSDEHNKLQGENTPPTLPPFGSPRSAPPTTRHLHFPLK